jgi:CubicO group peptidase (beta-lactamase class C family)
MFQGRTAHYIAAHSNNDFPSMSHVQRRDFIATGLAGLSLPLWSTPARAALTPQNTVAWHGRNTAEHKSLVDKWAADGFRTLSLSIYDEPANPLYAAVMVKRAAVHAEHQVFPRTHAQMLQEITDHAKQGRGMYLVGVTGTGNSTVYAASFKPMNDLPIVHLDMSRSDFSTINTAQHKAGRMLMWVDAFGDAANPRFAGVWNTNPGNVAWTIDGYDPATGKQDLDLPDNLLQQRFEAITSIGGRPSHIALSPSGATVESFVDTTIGPWVSRGAMSSQAYQDEFDKQVKAGRLPLQVSANGSGANARFAAIFATREETDARVHRNQGPVTVAAIDKVMKDYLEAENLRGVALAIARGNKLVYAKGYTWAEPGYTDITPQTLFRQASVSKTYCGVAMMRLMQLKPEIKLDTKVQSLMNLKQPNGSAPADSRWADITIQHLLESDSGIPQGLMYSSAAAAQAFNKPLPATHAQLLSYATTQMLTGAPGNKNNSVYGNFDYMFLGEIIAKVLGVGSFVQALEQLVLKPLGMTHTRGSRSLITDQLPGEARHHMTVYDPDASWALYPFEVLPDQRGLGGKLVPTHYGNLDYEMFTGAGGLSASVVDVARLGAMFSVRSGNPVLSSDTIDKMMQAVVDAGNTLKTSAGKGSHGYYGLDWAQINDAAKHVVTGSKGGWLPGQGTVLQFTTGGFTYAIAINGNADVKFDWMTPVATAAQAQSWSDDDLFHTAFGMPTLGTSFSPIINLPLNQLQSLKSMTMVRESMGVARPVRPHFILQR